MKTPRYVVYPSPREVDYALGILKRLHRRMLSKSVRLTQLINKRSKRNTRTVTDKLGRTYTKRFSGGASLIMRAQTWELAAQLLDEELENLICQKTSIEKQT